MLCPVDNATLDAVPADAGAVPVGACGAEVGGTCGAGDEGMSVPWPPPAPQLTLEQERHRARQLVEALQARAYAMATRARWTR